MGLYHLTNVLPNSQSGKASSNSGAVYNITLHPRSRSIVRKLTAAQMATKFPDPYKEQKPTSVRRGSSLVHNLSHTNPAHALTFNSSTFRINIILPFTTPSLQVVSPGLNFSSLSIDTVHHNDRFRPGYLSDHGICSQRNLRGGVPAASAIQLMQ
jgi:hypothetical protein